ncbi:hypothetical protein PG994_012081 [Apiospora phragmitis]|uniref:Mitochondrial distribution and morphology protein 31 n=1 Tax=Apiospora phragmitis TaxID=2905665 RepID=A0ABR1TUL9_9PEZI
MSSTARTSLFGRQACDRSTSRWTSSLPKYPPGSFQQVEHVLASPTPPSQQRWPTPNRATGALGTLLPASCTAAAETAMIGGIGHNAHIARLARTTFSRGVHNARGKPLPYRRKSTKSSADSSRSATPQKKAGAPEPVATPKPDTKINQTAPANHSYSGYFHLPHLPHLPHRPTREELLTAANGFWQRMKVRLKWASIRSMRPWNTDEWGAFLSFFLFGHLVWILLGTTTFVSLIIFSINTVFAQETLAKKIGDYLTQSAGVNVVFENAIVPRWKDGVISFRNVFVSRRPGQIKSTVSKGSSASAAAVAAERGKVVLEEDDGNYTQFDITINTVNVTLSFVKWWNGKGLLKDVEVKGVRGVVDRTHVHWSSANIDPYHTGMNISLVTLRSTFSDWRICLLPSTSQAGFDLIRGDEGPFGWIYEGNVDIVADVMFPADDDESLTKVVTEFYDRLEEAVTSNRYLHLLDSNTRRNKEDEIIQDPSVSEASNVPDEANPEAIPSIPASEEPSAMSILTPASGPPRYLVMDLRIHLNDVKATVPVFTSHLSYVNQALVRPIVAYINAKRAYIPIGCRIVKRSTDFDGSWTVFDCGLMNDVSAEVYSAFAHDVEDQQSRVRRLKKVGFWTLSLAVHALFMGMAGNVI